MALRCALALTVALLLSVGRAPALACACCTSVGERMDLAMPLNAGHVEELQRLRFEKIAQLFLGEADPDSVKGIATPSERYDLDAVWQQDRLVFAFRDAASRTGTLSLQRPGTVSIFHVDPRQQPDGGLGPALYKEWRLTAKAAGTGVFAPGLGPTRRDADPARLRSNCTSISDFTR